MRESELEKKLKAKLVYNGSWNEYEKEYFLTQNVTSIGRGGNIDLPFDSVEYIGEGYDEKGVGKIIRTSRNHAIILREGDKFILKDMGSKTGTYVNGIKIGEPQPDPWKVRFCHSENYYNEREPKIRERNKGKVTLNNGDIITLGKEMYADQHEFVFKIWDS